MERKVYKNKSYILLSSEGIVLSAGTLDEMLSYKIMPYYRNCTVKVRTHDLYLNDNTMLPPHCLFAG